MRHLFLGVPVDAVTKAEASRLAAAMLAEPRGHLITTPNPEMIVAAQADSDFMSALERSDLALPDGIGLLLVGWLKGRRLPERITGTDFIDELCRLGAEQGRSVFLLGGEAPAVAERAAEALKMRHPDLKIAGAVTGSRVYWETPSVPVIEGDALVRLKAAAPDILLVAFGHRKQELWIKNALPHLPSVRIAIGVGGAFDFIAGDIQRAPKPMRLMGLEWLWRLIKQPSRFKRIWTAVVIFPLLALFERRTGDQTGN